MPDFADDLNVLESPNVSKFSNVDVIADNFSSLDNNIVKLSCTEQPFISKSYNSDSISLSTSVKKSFPKHFTVSNSKIKYCLASSTVVQDKALVSNFMSFSDIISRRAFSTIPVTNTLCNTNYIKKSYILICHIQPSHINLFYQQFLK